MSIDELYKIFCKYPTISTDSRKIPKNSIFFALQGKNFNGNDFALDAINKGSAFAIVSHSLKSSDKKLIKVENVLKTLQALAKYHRFQLGTKILAITGSNGKTTTKELCKNILNKKYETLATLGNLNNHIGVPLTLLSLTKNINIGIIEMGANHPGEIDALCNIALPDYGLITNIGKAHLEGFGNIEGVTRAKGELYNFLVNNNKVIFLNSKNHYLTNLVPGNYNQLVTYNNARISGSIQSVNPFLKIHLLLDNQSLDIHTNLIGSYNIENVIAAIAVGKYFGVSHLRIKEAIESYIPDNNRSQLIDTGKNKIVMDAYNANPTSMISSINNFLDMKGNNKILFIGEMLELGNSSYLEHKNFVEYLAKNKIKKVICVGESFRELVKKPGYSFYKTVYDLVDELKRNPIHSSFILVKGSRANQLEKVLPYL